MANQVDFVALRDNPGQWVASYGPAISLNDSEDSRRRILSRRRLEDLQMRETCEKYLRQHLNDLA